MSDETIELPVDEKGEAALDALLNQAAPWQDAIKSARTLDEMLSGVTSIESDWPGHYYRSPKIKHLKSIQTMMAALQSSETVSVLEIQETLICYLVCVPDGKKLRRVTIEEIDEQFHPDDLQPFVDRLMARDGFLNGTEGNAVAPMTGAESTGD